MNLKKPLDVIGQIERLKAHGMIINDEEQAIRVLKKVSYYRFSGYALQFRVDPTKSAYKPGTTFESVYHLYLVDEQLRDLFRMYIEKVEVYYRTQISHGFVMNKCCAEPHDQHYDINNFYNKGGYQQVLDSFERERQYYRDSLIVKHHRNKYSSRMPLWVMVELMSFSNVSKLYSSMYISEKIVIANSVGVSYKTLENHLHCLSVLRNKCAYAARLYNTEYNPPARFNSDFLRKHPDVKGASLFAYALILLKRLPDEESKRNLVDSIERVIEQYKDDIDMELIGFPSDYYQILSNSISG